MMEIDYSNIPEAAPIRVNKWTPPRHVYFGPKDIDGSPMPEPVYVHVEYPRMMYQEKEGRLVAAIANDQAEYDKMTATGYKKTPADFGVITAPSFEQELELKQATIAARGPSRPRKE